MTVIVSMAGKGSRFSAAGYLVPKYRIMARGHSLFYWSMLSLVEFFDQHFIFACLGDEDVEWIRAAALVMGIKNISFHIRKEISQGQAETAFDASAVAVKDAPLWIYNIDTYVANKTMKPQDLSGCEGCIYVFSSNSPNMSFVSYDNDGYVACVAEKKVISEWATVGLYGFISAQEYERIYGLAYLEKNIESINNEFYITPMYEIMLRENKRICAPKLDNQDVNILGTPEQLLVFDPDVKPPVGNKL